MSVTICNQRQNILQETSQGQNAVWDDLYCPGVED